VEILRDDFAMAARFGLLRLFGALRRAALVVAPVGALVGILLPGLALVALDGNVFVPRRERRSGRRCARLFADRFLRLRSGAARFVALALGFAQLPREFRDARHVVGAGLLAFRAVFRLELARFVALGGFRLRDWFRSLRRGLLALGAGTERRFVGVQRLAVIVTAGIDDFDRRGRLDDSSAAFDVHQRERESPNSGVRHIPQNAKRADLRSS